MLGGAFANRGEVALGKMDERQLVAMACPEIFVLVQGTHEVRNRFGTEVRQRVSGLIPHFIITACEIVDG